jgi:hypothetical protein
MADQARLQAEQAAYIAQVRSAQAAFTVEKLDTTYQAPARSLWAGLSVDRPVFKADQTNDLRVEFVLFNDDNKAIDPKIQESRIVINGKELDDSALILSSVPKEVRSRVCHQERVFNSIVISGTSSRKPDSIEYLGRALVSSPQRSCSESCPKKLTDLGLGHEGLREAQ